VTYTVLAIDPGTTESAWVVLSPKGDLQSFGLAPNTDVLFGPVTSSLGSDAVLAIEMIASYGMPVGAEVFETCVWIGRFIEAWGGPYEYVYRREVKLHLCYNPRAKDANVRQALIDLYGGRRKAVGTKADPGPLHGVSKDVWAALGVGVTWQAKQKNAEVAAVLQRAAGRG